jgi:hypothetical protein
MVEKQSLAKQQIVKLKQRCQTWWKKNAATEGCETHSLVESLINAQAYSNF